MPHQFHAYEYLLISCVKEYYQSRNRTAEVNELYVKMLDVILEQHFDVIKDRMVRYKSPDSPELTKEFLRELFLKTEHLIN